MAVKTSTFTGWKFSGKDAEAFVKQIDEGRPNALAQESLVRGRVLCKQMQESGYSSLKPKKVNVLKAAYSRVKQLILK